MKTDNLFKKMKGLRNFGSRVIDARLDKGITQQELSDRVGLKQQAIQRIEVGKVKSSASIVLIAIVLEVCPIWLATGSGRIKCSCCTKIKA
jgi:ribosome-binding protein aMBF1 (putative translation factor)